MGVTFIRTHTLKKENNESKRIMIKIGTTDNDDSMTGKSLIELAFDIEIGIYDKLQL